MRLKDVPLGIKFRLNNTNCDYMRVNDIRTLKESYPDSVTAVNLDTYEVMLLHEDYEVHTYDTFRYVCTANCMYDDKCQCLSSVDVAAQYARYKDGCPCGYKSVWRLEKV